MLVNAGANPAIVGEIGPLARRRRNLGAFRSNSAKFRRTGPGMAKVRPIFGDWGPTQIDCGRVQPKFGRMQANFGPLRAKLGRLRSNSVKFGRSRPEVGTIKSPQVLPNSADNPKLAEVGPLLVALRPSLAQLGIGTHVAEFRQTSGKV